MSDQPEIYYRFEDVAYAPPADEWGDRSGPGTAEVEIRKYVAVRHTPKGVWVQEFYGPRPTCATALPHLRFVRTEATKKFAHPTKELAAESFVARKKAQIRIYNGKIRRAEEAIALMNRRMSAT